MLADSLASLNAIHGDEKQRNDSDGPATYAPLNVCRRMVHFIMILVVLALISGLTFLYYGSQILFRTEMGEEFARYGMPQVRGFVGVMEILGGTAVLLGLAFAPLGALGAAGLTLLMILGLIVRLSLRDAPRRMVPAAALAVLNGVLLVLFVT